MSCDGVKCSPALIQDLAQDVICNAPIGSSFNSNVLYKGIPIDCKFLMRWFQNVYGTIEHCTTHANEKALKKPVEEVNYLKRSGFHVRVLKRCLENGTYYEEAM